jgi:hypothetical protein
MDTRRLFAAAAITLAGLAMFATAALVPPGNEDVQVACGFFGAIAVTVGLLHPFKLGWRGLAIAFACWIALGFVFPILQALR